MRNLKLIWDFRGPDSIEIAKHHHAHLLEYLKRKNLDIKITGVEKIGLNHDIAFLVVGEDQMKPIRDALKPHRGQVYTTI